MNKIIKFTNGAILAILDERNYSLESYYLIDSKTEIPRKYTTKTLLPAIPKLIELVSFTSEIDFYESEKEKLSVDEYSRQLRKLKAGFEEDEYEGVIWNDDIDAKYAHEKFVKKWKPVYKKVKHTKKLEFEIFECLAVEEDYKPHIIPQYHSPDFEFEKHYVCLDIKPVTIMQKVAQKYQFTQEKDSTWGPDKTKGKKWSSGNSWLFMKINANYAFGSEWRTKINLKANYITYDEAKKRVDNFEKIIDDAFKKEAAKIDNDKKLDFKAVYSSLENILYKFNKVDPKAKTSNYYQAAKRDLRELMESLIK